ncbi:nucleotidyltransferase family protein [Candidatus Woesearchaeota archaeon]|nr:nucleotidyltransferase family protein [Candidatus Woesearchaeota archaeon]
MVNAIVLAGTHQEKGRLIDGKNKALLDINGSYIVEYVINALKKSKNINDIILVGPKKELESRVNGCVVLQERGNFLNNAFYAYEESCSRGGEEYAFFVCCDIPLLTADSVDDFIDRCSLRKADFYFPIVSEDTLKDYSELKKPYMCLVEGKYRTGNSALVNVHNIKNKMLIDVAYSIRTLKEIIPKIGLVMHLGVVGLEAIWKHYIIKDLNLKYIRDCVSEKLGTRFEFIESKHPEICMDIDEKKDYLFLKSLMEKNISKRDVV